MTSSTWIFQGNPKTFDIDGYLNASSGVITWRVSRYAGQIEGFGCVHIWRSQAGDVGTAGIIAEGTIVEAPMIHADDTPARPFLMLPPSSKQLLRATSRFKWRLNA